MSEVIEMLRLEIDAIDDAILKLLKSRFDLVSKIGQIKNQNDQDILDLQREEEILERLSRKGILKKEQVTLIYQAIFALTKQIQEDKICSSNPFL